MKLLSRCLIALSGRLLLLCAFFTILLSLVAEAGAETVTILAFGDSITQGFKRNRTGVTWGIQEPPHGARVGGYEPHLEQAFARHEQAQDYDAYVYNWGYEGEETKTGLFRLKNILKYYSGIYKYVLLMEGANDLYAGVSASTTAFNLGAMVDACLASGVTPILATITPNTSTFYGFEISTEYNPEIVKVAESKKVILADQYAAVVANWRQLTSGDGLHLDDEGDQVMATTWHEALLQDERFSVPQVLTGGYLLLLGNKMSPQGAAE